MRKQKICELHSSLRLLMRQYRWSGFFPVEGLDQTDPNKIRFTMNSMYTIYYIASIIGHVLVTAIVFLWFMDKNMKLDSFSLLLFFGSALLGIIFSIKLAKNWPALISEAAVIEYSLAEIRTTKNTPTKCNVAAHIVMFLGLVEHLLSKYFKIKLVMTCSGETTLNYAVIKKYFLDKNFYVFEYVPYDPIIGILLEVSCLQATFIWNFVDVLIMLVSIYITSYFNDLNNAINSYEDKDLIPWSRLRGYHSQIVILLKKINTQLNFFLMVSFSSNLFFICYQLFNSLHWDVFGTAFCDPFGLVPAKPKPVYLIYYLFSFLFLVLRTLTLSILTANVHSAAQGPLLALYETPTSSCNIEVQRFQLQLRYTTIGLSGLFFHVTRKTIPRVIGTVITYELVLLQFSKNTTEDNIPVSSDKN